MERQLLSYLASENVKVPRGHMEEYNARFMSTMIARNDLAYSNRFGIDWIQALQSFHPLQPFQAAFNSGWSFDPAAAARQFGSPGIIYGTAMHHQQMIPLNREMLSTKMETRNPPKRTGEFEINSIGEDEVDVSNARGRKGRAAFDKWQQCELEAAFLSGHYPDHIRRQELSARLRVDEPRLQVWFQNRRARWRRVENTRKGPGRPSLRHPPSTCSGVPITRQELEIRRLTRTENRKRKYTVASPPDSGAEAPPDSLRVGLQINHEVERTDKKPETGQELCVLKCKAEVKTEMCDSELWAINDEEKAFSQTLIDFRRCSTPTDPTSHDALAALSLFSDSQPPDDRDKAVHERQSEQFYPITMPYRPPVNRGRHEKLTFSIDSILAR